MIEHWRGSIVLVESKLFFGQTEGHIGQALRQTENSDSRHSSYFRVRKNAPGPGLNEPGIQQHEPNFGLQSEGQPLCQTHSQGPTQQLE
jgi:hypothetical protein